MRHSFAADQTVKEVTMKKLPKILLFVATLSTPLLGFISAPALAQATTIDASQTLKDTQKEVKYLEQEISFAVARLKASEKKLQSSESDLEQKQADVRNAQARYAAEPTPENEQFLRNAEQRIELADLSIKSRIASVVRLETKHNDLQAKLSKLQGKVGVLSQKASKQRLAQKVKQETQSLKSQMAEQANLLQQRLDTLQVENDRLREAALIANEKRELAEERTIAALERAQAAELALAQAQGISDIQDEDILADDDNLSARQRVKKELARVSAKIAEGGNSGNGVNLYLRGERGADFGKFEYLGAQQYRAEAVIADIKSRFRVAGRVYQIKISQDSVGKDFVFYYDMSDPDEPRFITFKKELLTDSGQLAKNR